MDCKKLAFIIYDGIENSVFKSQVLQPLLDRLVINDNGKNNNLEIYLISFEKNKLDEKKLDFTVRPECSELCERNRTGTNGIQGLNVIILKRYAFWGKTSLLLASYQLKKIFNKIMPDQIIARGPLAGWVAIKALLSRARSPRVIFERKRKNRIEGDFSNKFLSKLTIQARGLCAQEYRFAYQYDSFWKKIFRKIIFYKLNKIESETYNTKKYNKNLQNKIYIESVSLALKEYLIKEFGADEHKIEIAKLDLPKNIDSWQVNIWRQEIREILGINQDDYVYCYSGSLKPWQCVPEVLDFFKKEYKKNPKSFLLILSGDLAAFEKLILESNIDKKNYALLNVKQAELYKYLSACDAGLMFRQNDIINWVSRPTKMLEYQAVGLKIIHNNTVGCLMGSKP